MNVYGADQETGEGSSWAAASFRRGAEMKRRSAAEWEGDSWLDSRPALESNIKRS